MKSIKARDPISMLSSVIHDLVYPHTDRFSGKELDDSSRMRAVKNTVCHALGYKSGSNLAHYLKQTAQKDHFANLQDEIRDNLDTLKTELETRFGGKINLDIFNASTISIRATRHPSGRLNLDSRLNDRGLHQQAKGLLIGNFDYREFYQAALQLYHFMILAGYEVQFEGMQGQEQLFSVFIPLDSNTEMTLHHWISGRIQPADMDAVKQFVDNKLIESINNSGLVFQTDLFGEFGKTDIPMIEVDDGVLIPDIYFTEKSTEGHKLHLYR